MELPADKHTNKHKKRPCRICGKWYAPHARSRGQQKTCGRSECKKQWHTKKCAEWNKKNPQYFRAIYLSKKLQAAQSDAHCCDAPSVPVEPKKPVLPGLPRKEVQEVMGVKLFVIIEYICQLLIRRFQEVNRSKPVKNKEENCTLPTDVVSRGDG
jgi:hypothetical protein